jgi:hypothetical protein
MVACGRRGRDVCAFAAGLCFSVWAVARELLLEGLLWIPEVTRYRGKLR